MGEGLAIVTSEDSGLAWPGWDDREVRERYLTRPNIARFWSFAGGGKDNFACDRDVLFGLSRQGFAHVLEQMAIANHQFLLRAAAYLVVQQRIRQFIVLGPGIPADDIYLHNTVNGIDPTAKVLYVDNDPVVLTHARYRAESQGYQMVVAADIFDSKALLADDQVTAFLDFSRPIAIIATAVLHYHPGDTDEVAAMMQTYVDALAEGSCTAITHFHDCFRDGYMQKFGAALGASLNTPVHCRTLDQIEQLFPDQDLLAPGVVPCVHWPHEADDDPWKFITAIAGGIGKKRTPCP